MVTIINVPKNLEGTDWEIDGVELDPVTWEPIQLNLRRKNADKETKDVRREPNGTDSGR